MSIVISSLSGFPFGPNTRPRQPPFLGRYSTAAGNVYTSISLSLSLSLCLCVWPVPVHEECHTGDDDDPLCALNEYKWDYIWS